MTDVPTSGPSRVRLNWRQVSLLYQRELRVALREKTIVINSILIPILLYPLLLWLALTAVTFVSGQTDKLRPRIVIRDWPAGHPALRRALERDPRLVLVESPSDEAQLQRMIRRGEVDGLLRFLPATNLGEPASSPREIAHPTDAGKAPYPNISRDQPPPDRGLSGVDASAPRNFQARITFDQSKEASAAALVRVKDEIAHYRVDWLKREGRRRGVDEVSWQGFTLSSRNAASKRQMGSFLMGLMLPVIFVVMVAVGCFYPAVDTLAGERERQTWETLLTTAANRLSIIAAKYFSVLTLGALAGGLNLMAVLLTFKPLLGPLLEGSELETRISLGAIPVFAIAGLLLAGFVAAGMMLFAVFARTFKEGQAMITPFYLLILLPVVFLQVPGLKLTLPLALVPVVNVTLLVRETISGTFHWLPLVVTILVSLGLIALCVRVAALVLQFEDVLVGSYDGSLGKFLKTRLIARG